MALFFPSCFCYSDDQADSDSEAVLTAELLEPLDEAGPGVTAAGDHPGEQEGMTTSHAC